MRSSNAAAIASALWDSADFAGAENHYQRALQESSTDIEALYGLGYLKLTQNDYAGATLLLERAYACTISLADGGRYARPWLEKIRRALAWNYYRLDRFDLAAEFFAFFPEHETLVTQLQAFRSTPPYRLPPECEEITLSFLGIDPLPIVALKIGQREYAFLLDIGSGQLIIDTSILRELSLPNFGITDAQLASGQQTPIGYTHLPLVILDDTPLYDLPAEVMDIRKFAPQIHGVIGTHLLQRFHILFDFDKQQLRLRPRRYPPFALFEDMTKVPFYLFDSHLILAAAQINNHQTMAYLTSGMAGGAFTIPSNTNYSKTLKQKGSMIDGVSAGGTDTVGVVEAECISLGKWQQSDIEGLAGFFPESLRWKYGFELQLLLSYQYFCNSTFWGFNFNEPEIYLC